MSMAVERAEQRMPGASPVVSVTMGYGHLRAAFALGSELGVPVVEADTPPLAGAADLRVWRWARLAYEALSRLSQRPFVRFVAGPVLARLTRIPRIDGNRDLCRPDLAARALAELVRRGFGRRLAQAAARWDETLVTTFYMPAVAADAAGLQRVICVVTDTDVARIWVPRAPSASHIVYCVPARRTARRLIAYGVAPEMVHVTGFPLPPELAASAASDLERRLNRLTKDGSERQPPRLTLAVGGAGAQAERALTLTRAVVPLVLAGRLRLTLVAATHRDLASAFRRELERAGLDPGGPEAQSGVLVADAVPTYLERFNSLLADTDLLWTKPSELSFFAALGLPLLLAPPVGDHEEANRELVLAAGAGFDQPPASLFSSWLSDRLADASLAAAAKAGFAALPRDGAVRIADIVSTL
ncbi:MAG: hypothetical protein LJE95_06660 [Acidobacteria bacterium]|nr:hypothetical protein [Acidobacteriota bacterium]